MLDAGVVIKAVSGKVLAVTGVLEATVRHLRNDGNVGVDPHDTKVKLLCHAHRAAVVLSPHR